MKNQSIFYVPFIEISDAYINLTRNVYNLEAYSCIITRILQLKFQ
jgi:hypothetical protein